MRKIRREMMKKEQGNSRIRNSWRKMQIEKYGIGKWLGMINSGKRKESQWTIENALMNIN